MAAAAAAGYEYIRKMLDPSSVFLSRSWLCDDHLDRCRLRKTSIVVDVAVGAMDTHRDQFSILLVL